MGGLSRFRFLLLCSPAANLATAAAAPHFPFVLYVPWYIYCDLVRELQWPWSYCDTKQSCCYPLTGKPATDFGIHGLWPNYNDGSYPSSCDTSNPFDSSKVLDLISRMQTERPSLSCPSSDDTKFWSHEWVKHGTCSEPILNQYGYFKAALDLKNQIDILQILTNAGIEPNGETYSLGSIKNAIKGAIGYMPFP
ncbi:Extracellular ribonuclease LE-like protein [Drosera capensis]